MSARRCHRARHRGRERSARPWSSRTGRPHLYIFVIFLSGQAAAGPGWHRRSSVSAVDQLSRLAQAARLGNADALESFIRASYVQVWRFCAALADPAAADDLTQETYTRCVRGLPQFRGDGPALTWLLSIARHVCAGELRSRIRTRNATADWPAGPDWITVPDASGQVAVADLLRRLGPERRAAFVLTQLLGLRYAEAAAVCDCPEGTIRSRVARAREDLITMLSAAETVPADRRQAGANLTC